MPVGPQVGEKYTSLRCQFLETHGIPEGVEFVVTNTSEDKISLYMVHLNGRQCPGKLTIAKPFFGNHFQIDALAPDFSKTYAMSKHFYPEVNAESIPIFPSPHYQHLKRR